MKSNEVLCIYHSNCADGFGAAWSVRNALGDSVKFHPGVYQEDPPDVRRKYVVFVDFCYPMEVLAEMLKSAYGILIIDHHKSAMKAFCDASNSLPRKFINMSEWSGRVDFSRYKENLMLDDFENCNRAIYGYFDLDRSGAMMAWQFFNESEPPKLIRHIQDRDLWRFELEQTREIQAALFSYPYDFDVWDHLMRTIPSRLANDGEAIERKHFKDIQELINLAADRMTIAGHNVPVLNAPYFYSSDAGHIMSRNEAFAACYYFTEKKVVFSLRSQEKGIDVSEVALSYGGGGHKNAAGFSINFDEFVKLKGGE